MNVMKLLENVAVKRIVNYNTTEIEHVASDSREIKDNTLFVCLRGGQVDGHDYAKQAMKKGAVALVTEEELDLSLPQFVVEDTRRALAIIAGIFYGHPAERMKLITIVGTNGKTSMAEILSEIFLSSGRRAGTIGTLGYKIDRDRLFGSMTTPDPLELHKHLMEFEKAGVEYVFLEASAHAIYYDKLAGIRANATVFTNITQDHLDFFKDMEAYASTKLSYFSLANTSLSIVNSDDPYGRRLIAAHKVPTITYGINNPADVFAIDVEEGEDGLSFTVNAFDRIETILTPLRGKFNVYNVMAAIATAMYFGIDLPTIAKALERIPTVPGRYQVYRVKGRKVIVDFAHTPDGLENLLGGLKEEKRVVTVFGCGGNRDRSKRPMMGAIAAKYSDFVIVTDDNPRFEAEKDIAEEIVRGMPTDTLCEIVLNRENAIRRAFELTREGDTIVLAGKGHEQYIEINGQKIPYSDRAVLEKLDR